MRQFGNLRIAAENIQLKKLLQRRTGLLGRLRPKPGSGFTLRAFGEDFRFDHQRLMHLGTRGDFGFQVRTSALERLVDKVVLAPNHLKVDFSGEEPRLSALGNHSVLLLRHGHDRRSFRIIVLTAPGNRPYQIKQKFDLKVLERINGDLYQISDYGINQAKQSGHENFEVEYSIRDSVIAWPNDTILVPLGASRNLAQGGPVPLLWLKLVFEPREVQPLAPGRKGIKTDPLRVLMGKDLKPVPFQSLTAEQQVAVLRKLGVDPTSLIPEADRESVVDAAKGLAPFPGLQQLVGERAVDRHLRDQAKAGELVHSLAVVSPEMLASPQEFAKTQVEAALRKRPDYQDLLQRVEILKTRMGAENYFETIPDVDAQQRLLEVADQAWDQGFTVGEVELSRQYVWEIFALNWLLRYESQRKTTEEK